MCVLFFLNNQRVLCAILYTTHLKHLLATVPVNHIELETPLHLSPTELETPLHLSLLFFLQNKKEEGKIRRTKRPVVLPSSKTLRRSKTPFLSSQSSHRNKQGAAIHPPRCYSTRYRLLLAAFLVLDSSLSAGASISNQCEFGVWGLFLDFAIIDFLWGFDLVL